MLYSNAEPTSDDRRSRQREVFTVTMQYALGEVKDELLQSIRGMGLSSNLSDNGMGFYTDRGLGQGQCLMLFSPQVKEEPICAEVRWCIPHAKGLYKVGVAFRPDLTH